MPALIEPFDVASAPEAELRLRHELACAIHDEEEPEDDRIPYERWCAELAQTQPWRTTRRWTAWDESRTSLLGTGQLNLQHLETNRNLAWFHITVAPSARRQGVATRLLAELLPVAEAEGRTILGSNALEASPGIRFLEALGADAKSTERKSRLLIADVDSDLMAEWCERAAERAADYELISWLSPCPEEHLGRFVPLTEVMNTAPRDDLEMEDWVADPERFRISEQQGIDLGWTTWTIVARHKLTGDFAGYTEVSFSPDHPDHGWQGATAVDPVHRDKGLGRWLKAAMVRNVMDEKPEITRIDTWNAFSNGPMLGINIAMGFQLVRGYTDYQAPTERLAKAVEQRLG